MMHRIEDFGCGTEFELLFHSGTLAAREPLGARRYWNEFQPRRSYSSHNCSLEDGQLIWVCGFESTPVPIDQSPHMVDQYCQCHGSGEAC